MNVLQHIRVRTRTSSSYWYSNFLDGAVNRQRAREHVLSGITSWHTTKSTEKVLLND